MIWIGIPLFILWMYLLRVTKKAGLGFWNFFLGSVGSFVFMLIYVQPILLQPLTKLVTAATGAIGNLTGTFQPYFLEGAVFVQSAGDSISLYLNYECSGIIEIMVFLALLWFFPVYQWNEKLLLSMIGMVTIFVANVLRIIAICLTLHWFGNDMYFLAHTIIGRLFFYLITIVLYYQVFTKGQLVRQKVGKFKYETH